MAIPVSGQVQKGVLPSLSSGTSSQPLTQGQYGEVLVSELNARYTNLVLAGQVFGITYASGTVAAPSATSTGPFALFNPAGSGKNLVLLETTIPVTTFTAGTTGAGFGFQFVANQTPSAITAGNTQLNALIGSSNASVAKTYTAGTLVGAPTTIGYLVSGAYLDLAAGNNQIAQSSDIGGAIVIAPNSGICIVMTGTLVCTLVPSVLWAEVPV